MRTADVGCVRAGSSVVGHGTAVRRARNLWVAAGMTAGDRGSGLAVGVRLQAQDGLLVGAGEDDGRHQGVVAVAPSARAVQGDGDPGGVTGAGQMAWRDEVDLDRRSFGHGHLRARDVRAEAGAGCAVGGDGARGEGAFLAAVLISVIA